MSYQRSPRSHDPSSFDSLYIRHPGNRACQRPSTPDRLRNDDNNNKVLLPPPPPPLSKNTIAMSPLPSPTISDVLNEPLSQLNYGAGETRYQNIIRNSRERQSMSARLPHEIPLCRRTSSEHMMFLDPNLNPIYDEALSFVSYSRNLLDSKRNKICAEFMSEHFRCPVCLDVLIESTAVDCGHIFCRSCIHTWLHQKPTCPVCQRRVTVCLFQGDIDDAITNIAPNLPEEWQSRRQIALHMRTHFEHAPFDIPTSSSYQVVLDKLSGLFSACRRVQETGSRVLGNCAYELGKGALWVHDRTTLKDVVKGMIFGSFLMILWLYGDQCLDFLQYSYYAITSYDRNAPAEKQIDAVRNKLAQVPEHALAIANKPYFQTFKTSDDTIYANFIKLFYNGWN